MFPRSRNLFGKTQPCGQCNGFGHLPSGNVCIQCGGTGKTYNKFNRTKTEYGGHKYDSKKEAQKAMELDMLKKAGVIEDWRPHPAYVVFPRYINEFTGKIVLPIRYTPDFWVKHKDGSEECIDIKGFETADFKLRAKLFRYKYNGRIKLTIE